MKRGAACLAICALLATPAAVSAADAAKGAKLHEDCLGCHGTEVYLAPRARVKSLSQLRQETEKWNDRMNPKFTRKEIEDLVAFLNASFYKLPR